MSLCLSFSVIFPLLPHPLSLSHCPPVCENCMEVDLAAVAAIIIVDICITLGLLLLVYYWSKNRKTKAKPVTRGVGAGSRPGGKKHGVGWEKIPSLGPDGQQVKMASMEHSLCCHNLNRGFHISDYFSPSHLRKGQKCSVTGWASSNAC